MEDFLNDTFGTDVGPVVLHGVYFFAILILTWIARRVVGWLLPPVVRRLARRTRNDIDDRFVAALEAPVRFLITIGGLWLAVTELELPDPYGSVAGLIFASLMVWGVFWAIFRLVDPLVDILTHLGDFAVNREQPLDEQLAEKLGRVLKQIAKGLVVVFGFAVLLDTWNYDVAGLIAGLGIAGAAVALATKDTIENLFGYFVILADEPFIHGEYVVFNGISGIVEHIGFRSTRIRVLDQSLVTVPNSTVMSANITNWSRLTKRRLNMTVGITYDSSPDRVLSVVQGIRDMLRNHEAVQEDSVVVQFVEFNSSSLDLMVICFMSIPGWNEFQAAKQDINLRIMDIVHERGADFAFPTRTVVLEQAAPPETLDDGQLVYLPPEPESSEDIATDSPVPDDAAN